MGTADKNVSNTAGCRIKYRFNLRKLRLSLKYRPEILKLVLKMRQCLRKKNVVLKKLRQQLRGMEQANREVIENNDDNENNGQEGDDLNKSSEQGRIKKYVENHINTATQTNTSFVEENIDGDIKNKEITGIDKSTSCEYNVKDNFSQTKAQQEETVTNPTLNDENKINITDKPNITNEELNFEESTVVDASELKTCEETTVIDKLVDTLDDITLENTDTGELSKEAFTQTELALSEDKETRTDDIISTNDKEQLSVKDSFTQTDIEGSEEKSIEVGTDVKTTDKSLGWAKADNGEEEKSIAEQVKEVAQNAMQQSGMVYVESAGMYYDYKTGYYYNSDLGLYYHTDTECYYYYSEEQKTFVFHSYPDRSAEAHKGPDKQIRKAKKNKKDEDTAEASKPKRKRMTKHKKIKKDKKPESSDKDKTAQSNNKKDKDEETKEESGKENGEKEIGETKAELEDGECSDSDDEKSGSSDAGSDVSTSTASDDESVAKHHPPCMRVIVRETNLPKLKVGSLFLVTKDGGTIGREGEHHAILLKDYNVSRNHLNIEFNSDKRIYTAVDLGSKNGTILNGVRMSDSQEVSEAMEVVHGSTLQLGETKLLCHIHAGNDTCGHCEPGLIIEAEEKEKKTAYTRTCSVQKQHQLELARLKNKYAPKQLAIEETSYNDRAQARRETVGSSHHSEKTQVADLDTCIAADNKGFKLLEKMGWSKGEGLGKDGQGDTEPIPLISNEGKSGLGAAAAPSIQPTTIGTATLRLAARTKMLQPPAKAFQQPIDDDSE